MTDHEVTYDDQQQQAIQLCCDTKRRLVSVTGGPGTGKTTIMRAVGEALTQAGYVVVACAPTGKAARRIQEATGLPAVTQHKLLEYPHPGERDEKTGKALTPGEPKRDRQNPLDCDVILADEYAMVNNEIHRNLIDALPRGGSLRCFGDVNQLGPIELNKTLMLKPSPFKTILEKFDSVMLDTVHRQDEGSNIITNANAILQGRMPRTYPDFKVVMTREPVGTLRSFVINAREEGLDFMQSENQIIVPTNKTFVGAIKLNILLQSILNRQPNARYVELPRHKWHSDKKYRVTIGDKVMFTSNNYDLEVMNGELGRIVDISEEYDEIVIDFGDRVVSVPPQLPTINKRGEEVMYDPRRDIDLAYAITTHKSQGSEYNHVVYVINRSSSFILERANIYTAITRAKERVTLITDQFALTTAVTRKVSKMNQLDMEKRKRG